jgi:chromosome segregation ATPase
MVAEFSYLVAQLALFLVLALVVGVLGGRYLWPGRAARARLRGDLDASAVEALKLRLAASEATVQELRTTVTTITDHKDTEMGSLESRAIQAMDSLVLSHEERVQALRTQVETLTTQVRHHEREIEAERRHTLRLQAALVERDERITTMAEELAEKGKRQGLMNGVASAATND